MDGLVKRQNIPAMPVGSRKGHAFRQTGAHLPDLPDLQRSDDKIGIMINLSPSLRVGEHEIARPALLAPMSGVTDHGMRRVAARFGAGLVVSEMVAADQLAAGG